MEVSYEYPISCALYGHHQRPIEGRASVDACSCTSTFQPRTYNKIYHLSLTECHRRGLGALAVAFSRGINAHAVVVFPPSTAFQACRAKTRELWVAKIWKTQLLRCYGCSLVVLILDHKWNFHDEDIATLSRYQPQQWLVRQRATLIGD
jgi:hypothetical protein